MEIAGAQELFEGIQDTQLCWNPLYSLNMRDSQPAGYREVEHTADWEIEAWGPDLAELLVQAASGMYALAKTRLDPGPRQYRLLDLTAEDPERLVVTFLSELLYLGETENLGFDDFDLILEDGRLKARLGGAPLASQEKEIKAVTYHNLEIRRDELGLSARVVFDV